MENIRNKLKKIRLYFFLFFIIVYFDIEKSNKGLYVYMFKFFFGGILV